MSHWLASDGTGRHYYYSTRNHCVPLLDVLHPPLKDGGRVLRVLVMPYLRPFDSPIFDIFSEAIDCIRQLFEVTLNPFFRKHLTVSSSSGIAVYA